MPQETLAGYIEIRVFVHATEDTEKVLAAVRNILPENQGKSLVLKKTALTGHHKNPIMLFKGKLSAKKDLLGILQRMARSLNTLDKETLRNEFERHLERKNLYLRLDKQLAYLGETKLSSNDPIHFKIHFKNRSSDEIFKIIREIGVIP